VSRLQAGCLENGGLTSGRKLPDWLLSSTQPHAQGVLVTLFSMVKLSECEADRSPPSGAEVKNAWIYTSIPACALWHDV
jgi:hypothetical protein